MLSHFAGILSAALRSSVRLTVGAPVPVRGVRRSIAGGLCLLAAGFTPSLSAQSATPVNVPTWRYDNLHQGQNTQETLLTPANVAPTTFGKLFSLAVDGYVFAQPLYESGLTMGDGQVHNVVFIATEHDSVYAFDADSNGGTNAYPLWQASMLSPAYGAAAGAATLPAYDVGISDITPEIGITSTPAINIATQTLYVVSKTAENGGYVQRLHALNLITGAEQPGSPVVITASVPGAGSGAAGGVLPFSPLWQNNRTAVIYNNGYVYLGFGSHGDNGPWHGWVLAYNATTLAQTGAICTSPNGIGDGTWGSGAGMPIDSGGTAGRMYLSTGNGSFSSYPPITAGTDFGDSIVQLDLSNGGVTATDAFTPFNQASLSASDVDQGSGGVLILPDQQGSYPHILMQAGKEGRILVLNRDNMGGYAPGGSYNTNALQDIPNAIKGLWSEPAYWNGNVYFWGSLDTIKAFSLNSGVLSTTPFSQGTVTSAFPGSSPVVSSNGTQNGIVWAIRSDAYANSGPAILYAFNANSLTTPIYESDTNSRDAAGTATKFVVPVVTNGKVYVGAAYEVDIYGLLNGVAIASSPTFSQPSGNYSSSFSVALASTTPNAAIYYTLDGTTPTTASNLYSTPITINASTVVKALSTAQGYLQSAVTSAAYVFPSQTPAVTFNPGGGTYNAAQQVSLSDVDPNAVIYYTLDGSTPTTSSATYSGPITVSSSLTINALAVDGATPASSVASSAYVIQPTINYSQGFASVAGLTLNGSAINTDDSRLQITDGNPNEAGSFFYSTPVNVQAFTTNFGFQLSSAQAEGFTFTIQNAAATALGQNGASLGYGSSSSGSGIGQSVAIKFDFYNDAGEGSDSIGMYTNGAVPTTPAVDMTSSGLMLASGDAIQGQITYTNGSLNVTLTDTVANTSFTQQFPVNLTQTIGSNTAYVGFTGSSGALSASQKIVSWTYNVLAAAGTSAPAFSPAAGSYTTPQSVTITSSTPNANIYYTVNGTTPTTKSTLYSGAFTVPNGSTTVNAIAVANGTTSAVSTASYAINPPTAAPTFSPVGGNFTAAQKVYLADATLHSTIYYTTDGSTPTVTSPVYTAPITAPPGTTTINAVALATNYSLGPVSSNTYVVTPLTPNVAFSPVAGSYNTAQTVTLTDSLAGAVIYYTTDGSKPTTSSQVYSGPITAPSGTTLVQALAQAPNYTASSVLGAKYVVSINGAPSPTFSPAAGNFTSTQSVSILDSAANAVLYYTTNGVTPTTSSPVYSGPIAIPVGTTTLKALAMVPTSSTGALTTGSYTVTLACPAPVISPAGGTYTSAQPVTITDGNPAATIYYTTNGNSPTTSSSIYSGPITISATGNLKTYAVAAGESNSPITAAAFVIAAAGPTMTPAAGTYNTPQTVTLADATPGAVIHYSTNGGNPTVNSPKYTAPITIATSETLQAIAIATGYSNSAITSAPYVIQSATPAFSPTAGTYTTTQTVTITDSTPKSTLYYTLDGSTPTTSSSVYSGPVTVATTETINAIAVTTGYTTSLIGTAAYSIPSPTPVITPAAGTYTSAQTVSISDSTASAAIYYTTDGSTPTTSSAVYTAPISVAANETIQAIAVATGFSSSAVASAVYTIALPAASPAFLPAAGTYSTTQSVTISDATPAAVIYYTTNGTTPTTASTVYSGPITVAAGETLEAIAVASGYSTSPVTSAAYVLQAATPVLSPATGTYNAAQTVTITDSTANSTLYYTLDGSTPSTSSSVYSGPISVAGTETVNAVAAATGYIASPVGTASYTLVVPTPVITPAAGTYTSTQTVTVTDASANATIYYTTNGSTPTTSSSVYTGPISVAANETIQAIAVAAGYSSSAGASAAYTITPPAATPALWPVGGTYTAAQSVTISDATPSSVIYYTTNGTTPTTSSAVYGGPISVAASQNIQAIALAPGYSSSALSSAVYTITPPAATPALSPSGGNYTTTQTVTISDATPSAVIYYTTNGAAPTTASAVYSGPIPVSASETIQAIAIATGYSSSTVSGAAYTITLATATPILSPAPGTYPATQTITIADATPGAVVYYTTNGTTPTTASAVYSGPVSVAASQTIEAMALASGAGSSAVAAASYVIAATAPAPTLTPAAGTYTTIQTVSIADTASGATIYYTTDGTTPTTASAVYSGPITVSASGTVAAIAGGAGFNNSRVASAHYVLNLPAVAAPTMTPSGGAYATAPTVTIADTNAGATIYYTTNGSNPTTASTVYSGPFTLTGTAAVRAIAAASGYSNSGVSSTTYSVTTPTPAFSPASGTYANAQTVTISDAIANATIYYTTNGTTPTSSSTVYSGPITVAATANVRAIAAAAGDTVSYVGSASYKLVTAPPTFSPAAGSYTSAQSVTVTSATTGATIYYTTDGTTPTIASSVYSGPVVVSTNATVKALAVLAGQSNSLVASATYTISPPQNHQPKYTSGFTSSSDFTLNGVAQLSKVNKSLVVTDTAAASAGAAWYSTPLDVNVFTTDFTFQMIDPVSEGLTFTIQNQGLSALGLEGSGLGSAKVAKSVAIKFDIYNNSGEGANSTGAYTNGATPTLPATDITSSGISLSSGHVFSEHMVYNGTSLQCKLTDTTTGKTYTGNYTLNLPSIVGGTTAYFGFTGSTGAKTVIGQILTWSYSNTVPATAAEPTLSPAPGVLSKAAMVSLRAESTQSLIHYTVDGSQPTAASPVFRAPISVESNAMTIKAYAVTPGKKDSAVITGTYRVNQPAEEHATQP